MDSSKNKVVMNIKTDDGKLYVATQEDIDDIVCTALEGGIAYWCTRCVPVDGYKGEYASDQISRGGSLDLHDGESNQIFRLTPEKFQAGLKKYIEEYANTGYLFHDGKNTRIDTCEIDACEADTIIQLALFNEIVYG